MEAVLRKHIQHLHNVRFIYCGSKKHTMTDMFTNAKKPFYESTTLLITSWNGREYTHTTHSGFAMRFILFPAARWT